MQYTTDSTWQFPLEVYTGHGVQTKENSSYYEQIDTKKKRIFDTNQEALSSIGSLPQAPYIQRMISVFFFLKCFATDQYVSRSAIS